MTPEHYALWPRIVVAFYCYYVFCAAHNFRRQSFPRGANIFGGVMATAPLILALQFGGFW
jgi:hypothetical protein